LTIGAPGDKSEGAAWELGRCSRRWKASIPRRRKCSRPRWIPPLGTNKALESNEFADTKSLQYRALCFEVPTPKHSGFPKQQWKNIRTTNVIERLNGEFRRRVKTQGSLPSEDAALVLLFGLIATGQIKLRKIDGYKKLAGVISEQMRRAA